MSEGLTTKERRCEALEILTPDDLPGQCGFVSVEEYNHHIKSTYDSLLKTQGTSERKWRMIFLT